MTHMERGRIIMSKRYWRLSAVGLGAAAVVLATAVPASASGAPFKVTYEAGYYTGAPAVPVETSASTQYTLPSITCSAKENAAIDPVVQVDDSNTANAQTGIRLRCDDGKATYQAQYLINGKRTYPTLAVKAGNVISETATQTKSGTSIELKDVTTGKSVKATGAGSKSDVNSEILLNRVYTNTKDTAAYIVPNFGHITFSHSTIDEKSVGSLNYGSTEMYSGPVGGSPPSNAHLLIAISGLSDSGTVFTGTFKASS
jgi:hypothetical protein